MGLVEYEKATVILRQDLSLLLCSGPCTISLVALAEDTLQVTFPETYRRFVTEFGSSPFVLGLIDASFDPMFRFDSVGRTIEDRLSYALPMHYVNVHDVGDGEVLCLDTAQTHDGDAPLISYQPGWPNEEQTWEQVEDSFGHFLLKVVQKKLAGLDNKAT